MSRALELARKGNYDALILDSSAAATDVAENIVLDRSDNSGSDIGGYLLQEDFFPIFFFERFMHKFGKLEPHLVF